MPFFIQWETGEEMHPGTQASGDYSLACLEIAGDPMRVRHWCGLPDDYVPSTLEFTFVSPRGTPGLMSVTFEGPNGRVTV